MPSKRYGRVSSGKNDPIARWRTPASRRIRRRQMAAVVNPLLNAGVGDVGGLRRGGGRRFSRRYRPARPPAPAGTDGLPDVAASASARSALAVGATNSRRDKAVLGPVRQASARQGCGRQQHLSAGGRRQYPRGNNNEVQRTTRAAAGPPRAARPAPQNVYQGPTGPAGGRWRRAGVHPRILAVAAAAAAGQPAPPKAAPDAAPRSAPAARGAVDGQDVGLICAGFWWAAHNP